MESVPFFIPGIVGGLARAHGVARIEDSTLVLEFEVRDNLFGTFRSGPKEVRVDTRDIDYATLEMGWWSTTLRIRSSDLNPLEDIPMSKQGQVALRVARQHRAIAQDLVTTLNLKISGHKLARVEKQLGL